MRDFSYIPTNRDAIVPWRRRLRTALFLSALTIFVRLPALVHPRAIDDENIYSVVAFEILEGGKPYVNAIERKPPGLFWTYAAIFALGGEYNWPFLHAVATAWVLLTMAALYGLGHRLFDHRAGVMAALFYSIYVSWATWRNLALNGEMLMNLPIAIGALLTLRRSASRVRPELFLAGALLCVAFLLKQPAAIAAVPLAVYLLLPAYRHARKLRPRHVLLQAAVFAAGFGLALAAVVVVLAKQGILAQAYYWTITDHDVPHGPTDPVFWIRGGRIAALFAGTCALPLIGTIGSIRWRRTLWRDCRAEFAALVGLLVVSMVGVSVTGRFYPHYFIQVLLPLVLLAAPVYAEAFAGRPPSDSWVWRPRVVKAWLGLTVVGFLVAHTIGLAIRWNGTDAGRYLAAYSDPADRIFVWGQATNIYLDAQRRPASRYVATFPLTGYIFGSPLSWDPGYSTEDRILAGAWDRFAADIRRHPPVYIVDAEAARQVPKYPPRDFPILERLLRQHYEMVYRSPDGLIYRRVDRPDAAAPLQ